MALQHLGLFLIFGYLTTLFQLTVYVGIAINCRMIVNDEMERARQQWCPI
jgi:hypothetical protein